MLGTSNCQAITVSYNAKHCVSPAQSWWVDEGYLTDLSNVLEVPPRCSQFTQSLSLQNIGPPDFDYSAGTVHVLNGVLFLPYSTCLGF